MVDDRLVVLLDDRVAGVLSRGDSGDLTFDYDAEYRALPEPTPLSLSLPVAIAHHGSRTVTPWLWGLLPGTEVVLELWARRFGVSLASPFGLLSAPPGADCAGAVRFVADDDGAVQAALERPGHVRWLEDGEVARRLDELTHDSAAWLGGDFAGRFSLAGAQAKTALFLEGERWGLPEGSAATTHILKPAIAGLDDHDLNEHLCLSAARAAGLPAARTQLVDIEGRSAVVVTRYDRVQIGTTWRRVHQEDICQALSISPARKYQSDGGPGPSDVTALLRSAMPTRRAESAVREFADALVWTWIIGGTDAHAKNYSLLLSGGQVRLAPMYDVASALPYGHERKLKLAMKFDDGYRLHTQRPSTWRVMAEQLAIDEDELRTRAGALVGRAGEAFTEATDQPGDIDRSLARRLVDAIHRRAQRCSSTLGV